MLFPTNVSRMSIGYKSMPVLARQVLHQGLTVDGLATTSASVDKDAGVARVVQQPKHMAVFQLAPEGSPFLVPEWSRRGNSNPSCRKARTVANAEPVRRNVSNTSRIAC